MRWRLGLALSLALHGVLVLLVVTLTVESSPRELFMDLLQGWQSGSPSAARGPAVASDAAPQRRTSALRASRARGGAGAPRTPGAPPAPSPAAAAPVATAPVEMSVPAPPSAPAVSAVPRVDVVVVEAPPAAGGDGSVAGNGTESAGGTRGLSAGDGPGGGRGGASLAALVPGGGAGGAGREYEGYFRVIHDRIRDAIEYPMAARRRGLTGTVEIEISIDAAGTIGRVTLIGSSSHALLDGAVVEAARGLGRTPFPPGLRPRALRVRLPFVLELR